MKIIVYLGVFLISFFPAYLGYQPEHAWLGFLITIGFALSCYIPFLRDTKRSGWKALVILSIFGYAIESIGVLTCFPYGCFSYSDQLGTKIFGIVPWILFATWPPLVIGVWSICRDGLVARLISGHATSVSLRPYIGGFLLVLIDLILDPIAVSMGLWFYPGSGFWFGVPLSNFVGWMISGIIGVVIVDHFLRKETITNTYDQGLRLTMSFFVGYAFWKWIFTFL